MKSGRIETVGDLKKLLGDDDSLPVFLCDWHEEYKELTSVYEDNLTFIKTCIAEYVTTAEQAKDDLEYNCDYEIIDVKPCKIIRIN